MRHTCLHKLALSSLLTIEEALNRTIGRFCCLLRSHLLINLKMMMDLRNPDKRHHTERTNDVLIHYFITKSFLSRRMFFQWHFTSHPIVVVVAARIDGEKRMPLKYIAQSKISVHIIFRLHPTSDAAYLMWIYVGSLYIPDGNS